MSVSLAILGGLLALDETSVGQFMISRPLVGGSEIPGWVWKSERFSNSSISRGSRPAAPAFRKRGLLRWSPWRLPCRLVGWLDWHWAWWLVW